MASSKHDNAGSADSSYSSGASPAAVQVPVSVLGKRVRRSHAKKACDSCRRRKIKCSEERDICRPCLEKGLDCHYSLGRRERQKMQEEIQQNEIRDLHDILFALSRHFNMSVQELMELGRKNMPNIESSDNTDDTDESSSNSQLPTPQSGSPAPPSSQDSSYPASTQSEVVPRNVSPSTAQSNSQAPRSSSLGSTMNTQPRSASEPFYSSTPMVNNHALRTPFPGPAMNIQVGSTSEPFYSSTPVVNNHALRAPFPGPAMNIQIGSASGDFYSMQQPLLNGPTPCPPVLDRPLNSGVVQKRISLASNPSSSDRISDFFEMYTTESIETMPGPFATYGATTMPYTTFMQASQFPMGYVDSRGFEII